MSYQTYGSNQGYGQYNSYGNDQQNYGGGYRDPEQGYEMSTVQNGQGASSGTTALLDKCTEINNGIRALTTKREQELALAQNQLLDSSTKQDEQLAYRKLNAIEDEINGASRLLRDRIKAIKQSPGSGDPGVQRQINLIGKNLRTEIAQHLDSQSKFRAKLKEQVGRRYRATGLPENEVEEAVESFFSGQEQTFQTSRNRMGQVNAANRATLERSNDIRKLTQSFTELNQLFSDLAALVEQQEPAVEQINQGAQEVVENVNNANKQIDSAIVSARKARRWKWYILLVVILIIAIVVGVVAGVVVTNNKKP